MAVVKDSIKAELAILFDAMKEYKDVEEAKEHYTNEMAKIIRNAILSATVNAGITVQVSPSSGTGATNGTGSLT